MINKTSVKIIISLLSVWLLIFLGVFLRTFKADRFPVDNNDDGLFYVWAGSSFLDTPLSPISHSIFSKDTSSLIWRSQFMDYVPLKRFGMKIVRPWFDQPPLAAVLISLPAKLLGYKNLEVVPHLIVRYPALIASIFTLFLTYLLAERLFGERVGRLSLLFFATVPYFVIAHRQSFLENFLTPLFLACLLYLLKFQQLKSKSNLVILMILSFLSGWIKVISFSVSFMVAGWLFYKKNFKAGLYLLMTGVASVSSYMLYGLLADSQIFLKTLLNQGIRGAFLSSFFFGFTKPKFYGDFNDGWYILGFLFSLFLLSKYKNEKIKFFAWFFINWLLVLFLLSGRFNNSPWYRYPLLPFMSMAIGFYMEKLLIKNNLFWIAPLFLLGLTGFDLINFEVNSALLRLLTLGFFAPYLLRLVSPKRIFSQTAYWFSRIFIVFLILLNIFVCLRYSAVHCSKEECLLPKKIVLNHEEFPPLNH